MGIKIIVLVICAALVAFFGLAGQVLAGPNVVINEIAWAGMTDGWRYEWIELFNETDSAVDIAGWQIENGASSNKTLILNSGEVPANGFFLICRKEMAGCDLVETKLSLHNEYNKNGKLILVDSSGNTIDTTPEPTSKAWPAGDNKTKHTMELTDNGWADSVNPNGTPKAQNSATAPSPPTLLQRQTSPEDEVRGGGLPCTECPADTIEDVELPSPITTVPSAPTPAPSEAVAYPTGITFNEVLPSPEGPDAENEWFELYNSNNFAVDLTNWQVKDRVGQTKSFICPTDTIIQPNNFLLVLRPQSNITLQNSGDGLILFDPNQKIVDEIDYPKASQGQSYNKTATGWFWSETLTPLQSNIISPQAPHQRQTLPAGEAEGTGLPWAGDAEGTSNFEGLSPTSTSTPSALANLLATKPPNKLPLFLLALLVAISTAIIAIFIKKGLQKNGQV